MVALSQIHELTRRIAEEFHPDKIILFGSCATALRAVPTLEVLEGSNDVDLLVIMPFEGSALRKAVEILTRVSPDFPIDLIARRPDDAKRYYSEHDPLICEAFDHGTVLYERRGDTTTPHCSLPPTGAARVSGRFSGLSPPKAALQASRFTAGNVSTPTVLFQPVSMGFPIRATKDRSVIVLRTRLPSPMAQSDGKIGARSGGDWITERVSSQSGRPKQAQDF